MLAKCRSTVNKMWKVAESLQDMGINKHIAFIAEDGDVRHAMKAEILIILLAIIGEVPDQAQVKFLQYVLHAPINEESKEEYFESVSRIGEAYYNTLLPYFCVIDKYANTELTETYLNFIAAIVIGCMKYSDTLNIALLQRYLSIITRGKQLVNRCLGKEISFEPLDFWEDETRLAVEKLCKVQEKQCEAKGLYRVIMKTLGKEIQDVGKKTALEEYIKSLNPRLFEIPKEQNDEVDNDVPLDTEDDGAISIDEAKAELDHLVGLGEVKWQVTSMMNIAKIRQECKNRGINRQPISYHMIYTGNPGTGKTTVARLMAKVYYSLGILSKGHLVEVSRAELVGEYVGHTAVKVQEVLKKAKGGVLFIDEAYSLVNTSGNDFGHEAIATLLKGMEDNRDDLVVIAAGYPDLMKKFLDSNPGLGSRFSKTIYFPDYGVEELGLIFSKLCDANNIKYGKSVMERVLSYFRVEVKHKTKNFGNARMVRNFFEEVLINQANRLAQKEEITDSMLQCIVVDDIPQKIYIDKL